MTLDDCEEIMRRIPDSASRSRRHIGGTVARLMKLAVYPCRWIERSPLPVGFLPKMNNRKLKAYLYPDEDRRLMACRLVLGDGSPAVSYEYRLLWGFLSREGMREGEALALTWGDLDLVRGAVTLLENKTDDPRSWALDPGVARALKLHREHYAPNATGADPVFLQRSKFGLALTLREHLARIGLKTERPELFTSTEQRQRIRVHDLRGTFVTLSLANGRSESWIADRTGHRSSEMINRYKRTARSFAELHLGELAPLDAAIPELAALAIRPTDPATVGHEVGQLAANYSKPIASPTGFEPVLQP